MLAKQYATSICCIATSFELVNSDVSQNLYYIIRF